MDTVGAAFRMGLPHEPRVPAMKNFVIAAAADSLAGLMTLLLLVFAAGVMDGATARLMTEPAHVFAFLAVAVAANLALQLADGLATSWTGRKAALSAAYSSGTRNSGILRTVLPTGADSDIFLFLPWRNPPYSCYRQ